MVMVMVEVKPNLLGAKKHQDATFHDILQRFEVAKRNSLTVVLVLVHFLKIKPLIAATKIVGYYKLKLRIILIVL